MGVIWCGKPRRRVQIVNQQPTTKNQQQKYTINNILYECVHMHKVWAVKLHFSPNKYRRSTVFGRSQFKKGLYRIVWYKPRIDAKSLANDLASYMQIVTYSGHSRFSNRTSTKSTKANGNHIPCIIVSISSCESARVYMRNSSISPVKGLALSIVNPTRAPRPQSPAISAGLSTTISSINSPLI